MTPERFMAKVQKQHGRNACWLWMGALYKDGYGQVRHGATSRAHRASFELFVGPIPDGLVIDHLCGVKHCVRPDHLEAVTQAENVRRAQAHKTHCPQGHPYSGANLYVNPTSGHRLCRCCMRKSAWRATVRKRQEREQRLLAEFDERVVAS